MTPEEDLADYMAAAVELPDTEEDWLALDAQALAERAAGVMRRLKWLKAQDDADDRLADAEITRANQWREMRKATRRNDIASCTLQLEGYGLWARDHGPKTKTVSFPAGEVATRPGRPRWEVEDKPAVEWAEKARPALVREKPAEKTFALSEAQKLYLVTEDGELMDKATKALVEIPGVKVFPGEITATVKPGGTS